MAGRLLDPERLRLLRTKCGGAPMVVTGQAVLPLAVAVVVCDRVAVAAVVSVVRLVETQPAVVLTGVVVPPRRWRPTRVCVFRRGRLKNGQFSRTRAPPATEATIADRSDVVRSLRGSSASYQRCPPPPLQKKRKKRGETSERK